jgi:hypothetical protein
MVGIPRCKGKRAASPQNSKVRLRVDRFANNQQKQVSALANSSRAIARLLHSTHKRDPIRATIPYTKQRQNSKADKKSFNRRWL